MNMELSMSKNKGGRSPKYDYTDKIFLMEIEGWARDGLDDIQIAKKLELSGDGFRRAKKRNPELVGALLRARRPLEVMVENSLFKRAIGTKVKTTVRRWLVNPDGTESDIREVTETETELPGDVKAIELWLRNRKPEMWNKQPHKVAATDPTGEHGAPLIFLSADQFTEEQIQQYINQNIDGQSDQLEM